MMATEQYAKSHWWCPMARVFRDWACSSSVVAGNRHPEDIDSAAKCLGSGCAMWRWARANPSGVVTTRFIRGPARDIVREPPRLPEAPADWIWRPADHSDDTWAGWEEPQAEANKRAGGYCGIAGGREP